MRKIAGGHGSSSKRVSDVGGHVHKVGLMSKNLTFHASPIPVPNCYKSLTSLAHRAGISAAPAAVPPRSPIISTHHQSHHHDADEVVRLFGRRRRRDVIAVRAVSCGGAEGRKGVQQR
jgi:hypothetical protein